MRNIKMIGANFYSQGSRFIFLMLYSMSVMVVCLLPSLGIYNWMLEEMISYSEEGGGNYLYIERIINDVFVLDSIEWLINIPYIIAVFYLIELSIRSNALTRKKIIYFSFCLIFFTVFGTINSYFLYINYVIYIFFVLFLLKEAFISKK